MRDLVRQGHSTFDLTFPISGPNKARAIFLLLRFFWVKELEKNKINIVTFDLNFRIFVPIKLE